MILEENELKSKKIRKFKGNLDKYFINSKNKINIDMNQAI